MVFVWWYKRLEKAKFKWPVDDLETVIQVDEQSLSWLLTGLTIRLPEPHKTLHYQPFG
jgi:transposase